MPVAQLMAGQRRGHQHQWIALWLQLMEEAYESLVQGAQPAALDPTIEQQQQIAGPYQGRQVGLGFQRRQQILDHSNTPCSHAGSALGCSGLPWNKRSRRSISSRGGRVKNTPRLAEPVPRKNRYRAPPMCRS